MVGVAIKWMFGGFFWMTAIVAVVGIIAGAAAPSWRHRGYLIAAFCVFSLIFWTDHIGQYVDDQAIVVTAAIWIAWFALAILVGAGFRSESDAESVAAVNALSEVALLEAVEHVGSLPAYGMLPWFARRWGEMTKDQRIAWVKTHDESLRTFIAQHGGMESTSAAAFVVELQRLDRHVAT